MIHALRVLWCRCFHRSVRFGGGRAYFCRACDLQFSVPWAAKEKAL